MKFERAPRGDQCHTPGSEVRTEFALFDEVVFLPLSGVKFHSEEVATEVIKGVTESRCTCGIYGKHILTFGVSIWEGKCLSLELAT